jgi:hypothetical protein
MTCLNEIYDRRAALLGPAVNTWLTDYYGWEEVPLESFNEDTGPWLYLTCNKFSRLAGRYSRRDSSQGIWLHLLTLELTSLKAPEALAAYVRAVDTGAFDTPTTEVMGFSLQHRLPHEEV